MKFTTVSYNAVFLIVLGKQIMHDPMAMRPFMGYNFGKYLQHWLDMKQPGRQMPKIYHVNWFRENSNGKFKAVVMYPFSASVNPLFS